jgi:hypothetical protein
MAISSPSWFMPASDLHANKEGLTTIPSDFAPKETTDRLETTIRTQGMNIFARIDHADGAREAGLDTLTNKVIANIPIGTTQALVYVPNAVPNGTGTDNLMPLGAAANTAPLHPA